MTDHPDRSTITPPQADKRDDPQQITQKPQLSAELIARELNKPAPLADMLPPGSIIGFEIPDDLPEHHARAMQAVACGVSYLESANMNQMTVNEVKGVIQRRRDLFEVFKGRADILYRSLMKAGLFIVLQKATNSALTLPAPTSWDDERTLMLIAAQMVSVYERFNQAGISTKSKPANVSRALDRLNSIQKVDGESVKADDEATEAVKE